MFGQGARRFVFFGRLGTKKQEAKDLVEDLRNGGADLSVIFGDVANFADVEKAIAQIPRPIGGVIQAAMGLNVSSPRLVRTPRVNQKVEGVVHSNDERSTTQKHRPVD